MKRARVRTVDQLKKYLGQGKTEFFILLRGGLRSSKYIQPTSQGRFWVVNYIDSTDQTLSQKQLVDDSLTNIGRAMEAGAFYCGCD